MDGVNDHGGGVCQHRQHREAEEALHGDDEGESRTGGKDGKLEG